MNKNLIVNVNTKQLGNINFSESVINDGKIFKFNN